MTAQQIQELAARIGATARAGLPVEGKAPGFRWCACCGLVAVDGAERCAACRSCSGCGAAGREHCPTCGRCDDCCPIFSLQLDEGSDG